jgi:protein import protein ZIM17
MGQELLSCLSGGGGVGEPLLLGSDSGQLWLRRAQGLWIHFVQKSSGQRPSEKTDSKVKSGEKQRHVIRKNMKTEELVVISSISSAGNGSCSPHSESTNSRARSSRQNSSPPGDAAANSGIATIHLHLCICLITTSCTMSLPSVTRTLQRVCLRQPSVTQACRQQLRHLSSRPSSAFPPLLRIQSHLPTTSLSQQRRCESTAKPLTDRPDELPKTEPRPEVPSYEMTFTCKACSTRSSHRMSKQGYHHGTILITCPGCKNRHLIADHLKVCINKVSSVSKSNADTSRSSPTRASPSKTSSLKRDNCSRRVL